MIFFLNFQYELELSFYDYFCLYKNSLPINIANVANVKNDPGMTGTHQFRAPTLVGRLNNGGTEHGPLRLTVPCLS